MRSSMIKKGDCWDNAVAGIFLGTVKKEIVHHKQYQTRIEAESDIITTIAMFYNRYRRHST